jgi:hypothetical protein
MFCTHCGSPNPEDAQTCARCSAPLVRREGYTPQRTEPPGGQPTPEPPSARPYSDPSRYSPPVYGSSSSGQPVPPGYQPYQGYQSSYAGYQPPLPASASGRAIAAMILSIVSAVTCGPFLSVPGLILGKMEMDAIRNGQAPPAGETYAKVGFYLGIVVTVLFCLLTPLLFWSVSHLSNR